MICAVVSKVSFPVVMYFFRVFGIVNAGFKLTLLAMLEKDFKIVPTKDTFLIL